MTSLVDFGLLDVAHWAAPRVCEQCERPYIPKYRARPGTQQRFCSKSCATAWRNHARPSVRPAGSPADWQRTRALARSRARHLRHAETWDGITDEEILERDGWRCQIPECKRRPIRKDLKYPHLRSKSVDYIVPLSLGGDDTAENKRAAHLGCNMARGNQMGEEQLPLFGSVREPPLATVTAGERAAMFKPRGPRKRRVCGCGAVPLKDRKFCQACADQRAAQAQQKAGPSSPVHYYVCRYCGDLNACRRTGQLREVCPARACQLARITANNLRLRQGMTQEEADALVVRQLRTGSGPGYGRWPRTAGHAA